MRKRTVIFMLTLLALAMFPLGYFDKEVTAFFTLQIKYGVSLVLLTGLYFYCIRLEMRVNRLRAFASEADERYFAALRENQRLHETICKIKTETKKKK